jgi:hypothetical protein
MREVITWHLDFIDKASSFLGIGRGDDAVNLTKRILDHYNLVVASNNIVELLLGVNDKLDILTPAEV